MVKPQGVAVHLVRHEDRYQYPQYDLPSASGEDQTTSTRVYVEVTTGERYAIVFVLTHDFDFGNSPDVRLRTRFEDHWIKVIYSAVEVREALRSKGWFVHTMTDKPALVDGKWMRSKFSFADLQIGRLPSMFKRCIQS